MTLDPLPPRARWSLRCRAADADAFAPVLGTALPPMLRAHERDGFAALRLGPDEWLLVGEAGWVPAAPVGAPPHALVDVSHRHAGVRLEGPGARRLLAAGCPLDLADAAFPVGAATRTLLGRAEAVLWRRGADAWEVEVWASFEAYLRAFLAEAARGA